MNEYNDHISSLDEPSFQKIRRIACDSIRHLSEERQNELHNSLSRGVDLLPSHELLCKYLWSFGNMHEAKIHTAVEKIPAQIFTDDFAVIDWGCGQGLATICFFDYLEKIGQKNKSKKIILIEPSPMALDRAKLHVKAYTQNENIIQPILKYLDEVNKSDIETHLPLTLHFFSNILDVEGIDLKRLAQLLGKNVQGEHYFCCVSPLYIGSRRIDVFYNYFNSPLIIDNSERSDNRLEILAEASYQRESKRNYTLKIKIFKFEKNENYYLPLEYYPAVQFQAAYQLDGVKNSFKTQPPNQIKALYQYLSNFEVSAPYDLGARAYHDVHPVLAVLNNIITRGLPTKASPFIENQFAAFGNRPVKNDFGSIEFELDDLDHQDLFLASHLVDPRLELTKNNYNSQILDSDLEKEYITNLAPHLYRQILQPQRSLTSITKDEKNYAQRVDFACEFPYSSNNSKGCVVELDGAAYHANPEADRQRDLDLNRSGWNCLRIPESQIDDISYKYFENDYMDNLNKAYLRGFDKKWLKALQLVLSPIAVARLQKTVLEALISEKLRLDQPEWQVLVLERDVPCAALAFEDLSQMFSHLLILTKDFTDLKFPQVNLEIISTSEFAHSELHLNKMVNTEASARQKNKEYDLIIDISMLRRTGLEDLSFSEFKCQNEAIFQIRSAHHRRGQRHIYTSETIDYKPLVVKDRQGNFNDLEDEKNNLQYFMRLLFRKEEFRPGQLPILSRALQNQCVIGLLPTGGGKSITYQLAAMLQPGVTIIIDPLRSLMKDQFDGLINIGIDTCTFINSSVTTSEREDREKLMESSQVQFVFLSPERLCIFKFRERLRTMHEMNVYFAYGVIDEVHCVSEWGHDFRTSYLHLGRNLYNYVHTKNVNKRLTLFGLTATASFDVLADVERELSGYGAFQLDTETIVRYENTNRLELQYRIEKVPVKIKAKSRNTKWEVYDAKNAYIADYITEQNKLLAELQTPENIQLIKDRFISRENLNPSINKNELEYIQNANLQAQVADDWLDPKNIYSQGAIVFCPHRQGTLGVNDNFRNSGIATAITQNTPCQNLGAFVGGDGMTDQDRFINNEIPIMVATKAFGMGIDKPNVRFTVNMNYSSSLEGFVQEAGRAGRDRKMALATILFSEVGNADKDVNMFFYNNTFKGAQHEKNVMHELLSNQLIQFFHTDDETDYIQSTNSVYGFLNTLLGAQPNENFIFFIDYVVGKNYNGLDKYEYVAKAIYRMCCIGVIDDFTQDYNHNQFRIVTRRKNDGEYYEFLKQFLTRYVSKESAEQEIKKVPDYRGQNEIHKCLGYLTEFVYEKIAAKRKRAIDGIHAFCVQGLDKTKDWKLVNEDLKDTLYYYFNSKYAKDDYETENGEPFSLTTDTDRGKTRSSYDTLFKYLRVVDVEVCGSTGSPNDSVKHLQGAVRLIRRSLTDENATLALLNAFCLAYLGTSNNKILEQELENSFQEGYKSFYEDTEDKMIFNHQIEKFLERLNEIHIEAGILEKMNTWRLQSELVIHNNWLRNFSKRYSQ